MDIARGFIIGLLIGIAVGYGLCDGEHSKPQPKPTIKQIVKKEAKINNINPKIIMAVIYVESSGKPYAVSKAGCLGAMQINPRFHFCKNYFDPEENIKVGSKLLASYINKYGLKKGLCAYNSGHKFLRNGYAEKVIKLAERMED